MEIFALSSLVGFHLIAPEEVVNICHGILRKLLNNYQKYALKILNNQKGNSIVYLFNDI